MDNRQSSARPDWLAARPGRRLTFMIRQPDLALVVDSEPNSPCRQVAKNNGTQASIQATDSLFPPDNIGGAYKALVDPVVADMPPFGYGHETSLRLQLRLDDVEGTGSDSRSEATHSA